MKRQTERGFSMYAEFEYADYRGEQTQTFTVQESSLATERKVWVGREGLGRAHLGEAEARLVRDGLNEFLDSLSDEVDARGEFVALADDTFDRIDQIRIRRGLEPDSDELELAVTYSFGGGAWSRWKQWHRDPNVVQSI